MFNEFEESPETLKTPPSRRVVSDEKHPFDARPIIDESLLLEPLERWNYANGFWKKPGGPPEEIDPLDII